MDVRALLLLAVYIIVVVAVGYVLIWFNDKYGPEDLRSPIRVVIFFIVLIVLLLKLLALGGIGL